MAKKEQINIRISEADKVIIQKAADMAGLSMSQYLRKVLVEISEAYIQERREEITEQQFEEKVASSVTTILTQASTDPRQLDFDDQKIISEFSGVPSEGT